jgi:SRSO17 transposase
LRVRRAHRGYLRSQQCKEGWVLIAWPEGDVEPSKYFFLTAASDAALEQLVFMTEMGRGTERDRKN